MYGNGGLKLWPKEYVLNMKTHENATEDDPNAQVDFCWDAEYIQMNSCFSDVYNNATPYQAWRAGFREGVKMSLDRGLRVNPQYFEEAIHWKNMQRLLIWLNIGADVKNGLWAMLGARHGCYKTNLTSWDYVNVRDFNLLKNIFDEDLAGVDDSNIMEKIQQYGIDLRNQIELDCATLDADASAFFKKVHINQYRKGFGFLDKE